MMVELLKYCLKFSFILFIFSSCEEEEKIYYKKEFSEEEKKELARSLVKGSNTYYYRGSKSQQNILLEALGYDSNHAELFQRFCSPFARRGYHKKFYQFCNRAVELDPLGNIGYRGYLYLYYFRDYQKALDDFDATDILTPNQVDYPQSLSVDYLRGICYLKIKNYEKSIFYFDKHIQLETEKVGVNYINSKTFLFKGIAHMKLKDFDAALKTFNTGLEVDEQNADLLLWTSKIHLEKGDKKTALRYVKEARKQFMKENHNSRYVVEEFFQTYIQDIEELELRIYSLVEI